MRYFIPLLVLIFIGCGGGGSGGEKEQEPTLPHSNVKKPVAKPINDPYFYQQWYLAKNNNFYNQYSINDKAHVNGGEYYKLYRGKGVKIAIIDDGLDVNHPDLQDASLTTYNVHTGGTDVSQNGNNSHGTKVTGIIAAQANERDIFGIASESEILFLKYYNPTNPVELQELFQKANEFGADIISNSWGTKGNVTDAQVDIIKYYVNKKNIKGNVPLIVFATGNEYIRKESDESAIEGVIGVGATDERNEKALYSNYGNHVDIMAPGGSLESSFGILSLYPTYLEQGEVLANEAGTSFAAPIVSGALAMLLQANPNLTKSDVEYLIKTTSDKIPCNDNYVGEYGHNIFCGYGKLNITKLLDKALGK